MNRRVAVRAVIYKNDLLLMVKSNKGDYKLPGGGLEKGEEHKNTVIREVLEETGYNVNNVREYLGEVIERHKDTFEEGSYFEMISHYYFCEIDDIIGVQKLDDYEKELDFKVEWVSIDRAIKNNEGLLNKNLEGMNDWIEREILTLKLIKEIVVNKGE